MRYDLYGNKTLQKIGELFMLSLYVHDKTNFGVKFETWGHCERIEIIIGKEKGSSFNDGKIFRTTIEMKKGNCKSYNEEYKMKVSVAFAALKCCLKEKKVTINLKRAMNRLNKKLEVKSEQ